MERYVGPVLDGMFDAALSRPVRDAILRRQDYRCFYCECQLAGWAVFDHFIPRHAGGRHDASNRVAACPPCDGRKGGRMPTDAEREKFTQISTSRPDGETK